MTTPSTTTAGVFAVPYTHSDVSKFQAILGGCVQHRPWFDDTVWNSGETTKRVHASAYLADAFTNGALYECWSVSSQVALVGVLLLNQVHYGRDAQCHFVFFDRSLRDKVALCQGLMGDAFQRYNLEVLRVEVPTYAHALALWARKKLGFKFEAEDRPLSWPRDATPLTEKAAMLGSRKHRATLYEGTWHDALCLSVTREEFTNRVGSQYQTRGHQRSADSRPDAQHPESAPAVFSRAESLPTMGTAERPSAASR